MAGAKPATAMDNLAATPRVPRANTESAAPVVDTGNVQATPQAEAALVNAVNVASAVKQIAPQRVTRSSRTDVEHATAAASSELAVDGPSGTARKPATAANTTATMLSVTHRIGSGWARPIATAPIAAAAAMTPPVMTWPVACVTTPDHANAVAPSTAAHRHAAVAATRVGARPGSAVSITACHGSSWIHSGAGVAVVVSNSSSPSRIALSCRLVASSSRCRPTRDRCHCRSSSAATVPRWTRSTIEGSSRPTGVSLGSARSTVCGPCATDSRHSGSGIASPPV